MLGISPTARALADDDVSLRELAAMRCVARLACASAQFMLDHIAGQLCI
jgi:hypothetical protein